MKNYQVALFILGLAIKHHQVCVGLCQQRRERRFRGQHRSPHLTTGRQPHHCLWRTLTPPGLSHITKRKKLIVNFAV